jgi:hypothetical protein
MFNVLDKIATLQTDSTDTPLNRVSLKVRTLKMSKEELKALGGDSFLKNIDEVY